MLDDSGQRDATPPDEPAQRSASSRTWLSPWRSCDASLRTNARPAMIVAVHDSRLVIAIHPAAPAKPAEGEPCNGCGVCCLVAPCPVGMLVSGKRHGACDALEWSDAEARYRCGMVDAPERYLPLGLGRVPGLRRLTARWSLRVIAAGIGCDCSVEPTGE